MKCLDVRRILPETSISSVIGCDEMTTRRNQLAIAACVLLSAGVLANLTVMQGTNKRGLAPLADPPRHMAQAPANGGQQAVPGPDQGTAQGGVVVLNSTNEAETIRAIQNNLKAAGYEPGRVDGEANMITRAAILAFEYDHGLPLQGEVSRSVLEQLVFASAGQVNERGSSRIIGERAAKIMQMVHRELRRLGYDPGSEDVLTGEAGKRAIRDFEIDQNLPATGRVSGRLVARLLRLEGQGRVALSE